MSTKTLEKTPPLSVRLTKAEREQLQAMAGGKTLSAYVKGVLFEDVSPTAEPTGLPLVDRALIARVLAILGSSKITLNLQHLAEEAEAGNIFLDYASRVRVLEACEDVRLMHNALMRALGKEVRAPSDHEVMAAIAFAQAAKPVGDS